jgi:tetratricopeptide (TPR) repeat protein
MKRHPEAAALFLCAALSVAWLDPYRERVSEGNALYNDKKYQEAAKKYSEASAYAPGENERKKLSFNRGGAAYMSGDYEEAIAHYRDAAACEDAGVQKKAFFNMGNAYQKMNKTREAFESYNNALKIDPHYDNARKNIEYLLKKRDDKNLKDRNEDDKDKRDKNGSKGGDDKTKGGRDGSKGGNKQEQGMNREQVKNLLQSMKNKPVRRAKGDGNEKRDLEKDW